MIAVPAVPDIVLSEPPEFTVTWLTVPLRLSIWIALAPGRLGLEGWPLPPNTLLLTVMLAQLLLGLGESPVLCAKMPIPFTPVAATGPFVVTVTMPPMFVDP